MNLQQAHAQYSRAEKAFIDAVADAVVGAVRQGLESVRAKGADSKLERQGAEFVLTAGDGRQWRSKYPWNIRRIAAREGLTLGPKSP